MAGKVLFLLAAVVGLLAIGLFAYFSSTEAVAPRGSQGPLTQNAPGTDPPTLAQPKGVPARAK